jgi:murein tripeptide amidase MpaA
MSRRATLALLALLAPAGAQAACTFVGGEISNPFAAGCGDRILTYVDTGVGADDIQLGYPPPIPVASLTPVAGFRQYASLFARHQDLMISTSFVQGTQVGTTVNAQPIWAYQLGDANNTVAGSTRIEPAIFINAGIHAREWQTPESATELMERIAFNGNDGGYHQYIAENMNLVVLPVLNVDGFLQTQLYPTTVTAHPAQPREGRMRRKNKRNPNTLAAIDADINTVADNFWGVDLNRNGDFGFGQNGGSSSSVTSLVYRGPSMASEPETAALRAAGALGPSSQLRMYSDTHSFTQAYLVSTTSDARLTAITQALLNKMRAVGPSRTYGVSFDNAAGDIGTTADHFNETYAIPGWTLEVEPINGSQDYGGLPHGHGGFITPDAHIARVRDDIARMYLRGAYVMAGPPSVREVMLTQVGAPGPTYHARWTETSPTARALTVLASTAVVPGASYEIWVAFDKPMRLAATPTPRLSLTVLDPSGGVIAQAFTNAGDWEFTVTGDATGALRYQGDAITTTFTMPSGTADFDSIRLRLSAVDLANSTIDANPATIAGWSAGHWTEYEDAAGVDGDDGGTDQSYSVDAPGTGTGGGGGGGGGGGAAFDLLALLVGLRLLLRRR